MKKLLVLLTAGVFISSLALASAPKQRNQCGNRKISVSHALVARIQERLTAQDFADLAAYLESFVTTAK